MLGKKPVWLALLLLNFLISVPAFCDSATSALLREMAKSWQNSEDRSTRELGNSLSSSVDSYDQLRVQREANRQRAENNSRQYSSGSQSQNYPPRGAQPYDRDNSVRCELGYPDCRR